MTKQERLQLANWAMNYALKQGADQVAVNITKSQNIDVEYREKKLEQLKESVQYGLNINLYIDHRFSGHSTNDLNKASLEKFIDKAIALTGYLDQDPYRELPDPLLYKGEENIQLQINDPLYTEIKTDKKIEIAAKIEDSALLMSDKIISITTGFSDNYSEGIKVHSNGFIGERAGTFFSAGAEVTVQGKNGKRPEDWCSITTRFFEDLCAPQYLSEQATNRALQKIGQDKISSAKMMMLVENRSANKLIAALRSALFGSAIQQGRSFLDGKLNKKIASEKLTMIDNPLVPKGLGSRLYDSEGIAAKQLPIIEKGILKNYYIDTYYGKKLNLKATTGSPSNTIFEPGENSIDDIIKNIKKGIFITSFLGGNSNTTTGDYSFGIQGFYIENGETIKPVSEMNISGNLNDLWNKLIEIGNDPYEFAALRCPSLLFEDIQFSGI
ncbi:TldD/PmbA family protein [candidate division KSB1 bacterium]|nr:TldD/PmbA family protein [candidate division KSB1 bacterium]